MAQAHLSRLQRRILAWLWAQEQRVKGTSQKGTIGTLLAEAEGQPC